MDFKQFILHQKENRQLLIISAIIIAIQFAVFKYFYPYPNFIPVESNSYIEAAANNQFINWWPIGYSKFLRLFSCFTSSDWVLVLFQYLLLQAALLHLLFTIYYFMHLGKWVFRVITGVSILNPLVIPISNYVSSDALFTALSLIWVAQLIWIIYRPSRNLLLMHAVIALLAFMVRSNASYYPFISLLAIWFTRLPVKEKKFGIGGMVLLLLIFIGCTQYEYQQQTGTVKFSAFASWQLAANALNGYAYTQQVSEEQVPEKFKPLHSFVNHYLDSLKQLHHRLNEEPGSYHLWNQNAPLIAYMNQRLNRDSTASPLKRRTKMANFYASYGWYLITTNPGPFFRYYILTNLLKYYSPPIGFMEWYNGGNNTVAPVIAKWFDWKNNKVYSRFGNKKITITHYFPALIAIINLVFVLSWVAFIIVTGFKQSILYARGIAWWIAMIWFTNLAFSVWASPAELGHQLFSVLITVIFEVLFISWLVHWAITAVNSKPGNNIPQPAI